MPTFTDQTGEIITLERIPERIVSLVPSQSEYLWDLGLEDKICGITKFCIHPESMFRSKERIGGTKNLNIEKIRQLKPDLIIGNKEENSKADIDLLRKEFPVWMSDIYTPEDAIKMMQEIGMMTGCHKKAGEILQRVVIALNNIRNSLAGKSVLYFIWQHPYMVAASSTYISALLTHLGLNNLAGNMKRYPELSEEDIRSLSPDLIFLSSEPFPFGQEHVNEFRKLSPTSKVIVTDGEILSWYGSHMQRLPDYIHMLKQQINS